MWPEWNKRGAAGIHASGHMSRALHNSGGCHPPGTIASSARLSLLGYPPGPGIGDEVRGAPGSLAYHAEDLVFTLSKTGSYCREGSERGYNLSGPHLTGSLDREHTEQGKVGSRRPRQRPAVITLKCISCFPPNPMRWLYDHLSEMKKLRLKRDLVTFPRSLGEAVAEPPRLGSRGKEYSRWTEHHQPRSRSSAGPGTLRAGRLMVRGI